MRYLVAFILCTLFYLPSPMYAQRCLPHMTGIKLSAGVVDGFHLNSDDLAYYANLSCDKYVRNNNKLVTGLEYLQKNYSHACGISPVASFTADGGYFYNLLSDNSKTLFCFLGTSAIAGYESVNWGKQLLSDGSTITSKDAFIYGMGITFEIEGYINDRWVLFSNVRERILWGSNVGKFHFQFGAGLKFMFR